MPAHLLRVDDLSDGVIERVLARARAFESGEAVELRSANNPALLGLLFMEPSLRTRVGFAAAAMRLGWQTVSVSEQRASERSMAESVADTLRVVAGMCTVVVTRLRQPISTVSEVSPVPLINGGDEGPQAEHPTQALIDVCAMEQELGPVRELHIAVCGDLRMRTSRSLLRLLGRRPPARLSLISLPELSASDDLLATTAFPLESRSLTDLSDVDVLYVAGIPHGAIPELQRGSLRVTQTILSRLPSSAIVLSPLPVIDEIDEEARRDSRVKVFQQSDRGVFVRMAILEQVTEAFPNPTTAS